MSNINEFAANIQYKGSFIAEFKIKNELVVLGSDAHFGGDVSVEVSTIYYNEQRTEKLGRVRMTIDGTVLLDGKENPSCSYHLVLIGEFASRMDISDEEFNSLLWANGSTALYGIARAKLETMSSIVLKNGKIVLPMINIIELLKNQFSEN